MGRKESNLYQYLAAIVVNVLSLVYGIGFGWASPNVVLLLSDESPLPSGKLNMEEASWVVGLLFVGAINGNLLFGYITNRFGRKNPLLLLAVPCIISWFLILFGQNVNHLYAARMLIGVFGGGVSVIVPQFLSEIACDRIRGILGSTFIFSLNIGILLAFVVGNYCDYEATPRLAITLIIVFVLVFFFFPDTTAALKKQNRFAEAQNSLRFYRGHISIETGKECEMLPLERNNVKIVPRNTNTIVTNPIENNRLRWSDFKSKEARKAITIGIVLILLNQLSGCFPMLNYTAFIFKESGSNLSPNLSAIVIGVIQLVGSSCSTVLVDRAGRKFLLVVSAMGTALGLVTLATYSMLKSQGYEVESFNWIPICSFSFTIFIVSWAVMTLPFLVITEIMPEKLKNFGFSFCMALLCSIAFIMLKYFPLLSDILGMHGSLYLFAGCSLFGALFIILVMPETKGKSYEAIMQSLR